MTSESGSFFLVQIAAVETTKAHRNRINPVSFEGLVQRLPDGFVIVDDSGTIRRTNQAFLDMIQVAAEGAVLGRNLGQWLTRPGVDFSVLQSYVRRHRFVRLWATTLRGEFGSSAEVELSAVGNDDVDPQYFGLLLRDRSNRASIFTEERQRACLNLIPQLVGKIALPQLVKKTTEEVEKSYILAALLLLDGNRTAAAELLGLSRQSLT